MQIRPRKITTTPAEPTAPTPVPRSAGVPGISGVHVDHRAARSVGDAITRAGGGIGRVRAAATPTARPDLTDIGRHGLAQVARDAGIPRSASTIARWAREGVPEKFRDRVAELVARRSLITRAGGAQAVADRIGASLSTVQRWQSGRTETMTGTRAAGLRQLGQADARTRTGLTPGARARIRATVRLEYRAGGHRSPDYREDRELMIPYSGYLPASVCEELAAAIAEGDDATVTAICEAMLTDEFMDATYSDDDGVHIVEMRAFELEWN